MGIVNLLYDQPFAKDRAGTQLELVYAEKTASTSDADVSFDLYTVPTDRVLELRAIAGLCAPGATQNVSYIEVYALTNLKAYRFAYAGPGAADARGVMNFQGPIYLPQGSTITILGHFNDGTNANALTASIWGVLFPRGNFQL